MIGRTKPGARRHLAGLDVAGERNRERIEVAIARGCTYVVHVSSLSMALQGIALIQM